jgi:hypothetical protein
MSFRHSLALALLVAAPIGAHAAVDCTAREPFLPHVCAGGDSAGLACVPDLTNVDDPLVCLSARPAENDFCLGAKCVIKFEKGSSFSAEMLIIADDNVSQPDEAQTIQNAVAVTVVFNFGKKGILSQTYQNLSATDLSSIVEAPTDTFGVGLSEALVRDQAELRLDGKAKIVNDLLFRPQDDDLAERLRAMFSSLGTPVIVKVGSVSVSDHLGDGLATVLRLKVKGSFVAP